MVTTGKERKHLKTIVRRRVDTGVGRTTTVAVGLRGSVPGIVVGSGRVDGATVSPRVVKEGPQGVVTPTDLTGPSALLGTEVLAV